ncbi:MAG TPA: 2-C-methyl-D-erythritol 4-phosphate cytidylyltransferase [Rhodothermales bacterium]|nr:2-C-methyl-D-erythritol 4-phosphate cytidylyltransferase [Rhodothermales bacterium]
MRALGHKAEVGVLIPAAGSGARMGGERKQFRSLGGEPLLVRTLMAFERHPQVRHIVVAVPSDCDKSFRDVLQGAGISKVSAVVPGGSTRQDSVLRALRALPASADVVLVHDAVRPFVRTEYISAVIAAVETFGAAALAVPVADTLRKGKDGSFGQTVPRDGLFRMQTPQGFRRTLLEEAYRVAARSHTRTTDDVALVMASDFPVHIVEGGPENVKITTPQDWNMAEALWPVWEAQMTDAGLNSGHLRREATCE